MQFGPGNDSAGATTTATPNSLTALRSAAVSLGLTGDEAQALLEVTGDQISDAMSQLATIAAYKTAHPASTFGQAASATDAVTPAQAKSMDSLIGTMTPGGEGQPEAAATVNQTGLISDIVGDILGTFYPFLMWGLASLFALIGAIILVVAVIKSPAGKAIIDIGAKAALAGLL